MAARQAVCYFCSKPDDSIQVVCETRCLICSRCQLSPVLRRLFIDSLDNKSTSSSPFDDTAPFASTTLSPGGRSGLGTGSIAAANGVNISGSCPICCMSLSMGMLRLVQGYKDTFRHQNEEESSGKSPASFELEEISPLIPQFLRRFKSTYEPVVEKFRGNDNNNAVAAYDPSDPFAGILIAPSAPNTPSTSNANVGTFNVTASAGKLTNNRKPPDNNDPNAANKMSAQGMMEMLIDCYCAQWVNVCRNGNDSMLTVMLRAATKKKFSQKTNDYKIKSIIDYLVSPSGAETPEMILFACLIGLRPKPTTKLSAAWSHIATTLLMTITFDRMQGPQHQAMVQKVNASYTAAPIVINATEIKQRMLKNLEQTLGVQFTRPCSVKKAVKVVKSLITNKHPYFIMASVTSQCMEYQSRPPWTAETMAKLYTIWLFVLWFEGVPLAKVTDTSTVNNAPGSTKKNNSRRNSEANLATDSASTSQPPTSRGTNRRGSSASNLNLDNGKAFTNRMDMLLGLDPIIERIWRSGPHPYLKFTSSTAAMTPTQLQFQQQQAYDYILQLDSILSAGDNQEFYYLNLSDDAFQQIAESYTMSIHELAILVVRCWEVEYGQIKQELNKAMLTSQRRTAIVGSYDITKATMTAKEKLAITRLLHFYREDAETASAAHHTSSSLPGIYQKYPGLYQFRGIDWDEVEHESHSNFYPFHIPQTLLTKSMCELNVLAEQVTNLLISQQVKDIEDDLAVKAKLAREAEENKLPDILQLFDSGTAHDGLTTHGIPIEEADMSDVDQDFEEAKEHFIEHMLEAERELAEAKLHPEASIQHRKAMFKKLKAHSVSASQFADMKSVELEDKQYETMFHGGHSRLPLVDERPIHALPSHLPRSGQHRQFDEMKESLSSGGLQMTSTSPSRPISGAHKRPLTKSMPDLHGMIEHIPGSEIPNLDKEPLERLGHILHYPKQQVTIVELIDNNTLALNQARMLPNSSRPTSALKRPTKDIPPELKLSHPSGVRLQSLEKTVADFPTAEDYTLTNNKRPSSKHHVRIETQITDASHGSSKIFVDNERLRIEKKENNINPEEAYKKSIDDYKKHKVMESRSRIMQRTSSTLNPALDSMQQEWRAATGSYAANHKESPLTNVTEDGDDPPLPSLSAADILGQFSRPNTSSDKNHSSQKRHRIVPYLNLAKCINEDGDLLMDLSNNLVTESSIQYLTLKDGKANLRALQQIVKLFFKDWQVEYMKIVDLSGNPGLQSTAARLISQAINVTCNIIHFNLNQAGIGDAGLKMLLDGIIAGKGVRHVLRLDLQENQITMASDAMSLLNGFKKLKALDLSKNFFTLDTGAQMRYLEFGLSGCKALEMLSLSFNKIQDGGFRGVCNIIEKYALPVRLLDVAGCFLTNRSADVLKNVLLHVAKQPYNPNNDTSGTDSALQALHKKLSPGNTRDHNKSESLDILFKLEKIFLHRNIFSHTVWDELLCDYQMGTMCKLLVNEPHTGIEIFPCYNLRDFGILAPSINPAII